MLIRNISRDRQHNKILGIVKSNGNTGENIYSGISKPENNSPKNESAYLHFGSVSFRSRPHLSVTAKLEEKINTLPKTSTLHSYVQNINYKTLEGSLYSTLGRIVDMYYNIQSNIEKVKDKHIKDLITKMLNADLKNKDLNFVEKFFAIIEKHIELQTMNDTEVFLAYLKEKVPEIYSEIQKKSEEINNPTYKILKADYQKWKVAEPIIEKCRSNKNNADELYENYLKDETFSNNEKTDKHIKNLCRQINNDFSVKVFLPSNLKNAGVGLKLVYQKLSQYQMRARANGQVAKMPTTLDFYTTNIAFIKNKTSSGEYNNKYNSISINGLTVEMIYKALEHELVHCNDTRRMSEFPALFNPNQCMQEFVNAGLSFKQFMYATTNPQEFIATAAEGDINKYSEWFQEILKSFGMPSWMFNNKNHISQKQQISPSNHLKIVSEIISELPLFAK